MSMPLLAQFPFSWRDILDILAVACLFYYTISFVRGTRAVAALNGLMVLLVVYTLAQVLGLFTLGWLLEKVFGSLVLIIVVLFHEDIRQALSRFSIRSLFKRRQTLREAQIQLLASTSLELLDPLLDNQQGWRTGLTSITNSKWKNRWSSRK